MPVRVVDPEERRLKARRILATAIEMSDGVGMEKLTMRALAKESGVATMTLYGYFADKEALLDAMMDEVLGGLELPPDAPALSIQEYIADWGVKLLELCQRHPAIVSVMSSRSSRSHAAMFASFERPLGALRAYGLSDEDAVRVFTTVLTAAIGFASYQNPRPWSRRAGDDTELTDELQRQQEHFYQALPLPKFSTMVGISSVLATMSDDETFHWLLTVLGEWSATHAER